MSNTTIRFPNLGIEVHPGKSIEVFGVELAFYGMIIGLAMMVGVFIAYREAKRTNQNVDDYLDFTIWALIMAIVGARLYYVIFEWDYYGQHLLQIVTGIRDGGLAIYGGIIASLITLFIFTKVKKLNFWLMADTAVLGLVVGQIIGRWGNFFNREAFGGYTNSIFAMQIPVNEANGVTKDLLMNSYLYNGQSFIQVHPTFLYEGIWNLGVFILLMAYRKHKKFNGEVFALYLIGYGVGRAWIEGLRTDQLILPFFKVPVSQVLSIVLVVVAIGFIIFNRIQLTRKSIAVVSLATGNKVERTQEDDSEEDSEYDSEDDSEDDSEEVEESEEAEELEKLEDSEEKIELTQDDDLKNYDTEVKK